jgi:hypothetical protein
MTETFKSKYLWLLRLTSYLWLNFILLVFGLFLTVFTNSWLQAIGASIVASAIVGLLFIYQLKIDRQFDDARKIYDMYGVVSIISERSNKRLYVKRLQRCKKSLDIIGLSLSRFYDDLGKDFLPRLDACGVKIRLLLLDPESPFVKSREIEELSPAQTNLSNEIRTATKYYCSLKLSNLKIKYYRSTPTLNYLRIDNIIFTGPYFVGMPSGQKPATVIRADYEMAYEYQDHFENIWNSFSRNVNCSKKE